MINLITLILSIALTTICCVFCNLLHTWYDFYIPILLTLAFFVGILIVFFTILFIISRFININKPVQKPKRFFIVMFNLVNDFIIFWSGAKIKVTGKEKINKNKKYLFVLNHNSNFDTMILSHIFRNMDIIYLSKPSNLKIPIAGGFVHKYGYLAIDRDNNRNAIVAITRANMRIKENNMSVGICPEGTRNKTQDKILPFKPGSFKIARMAKVPIAVVCLKNTRQIHKNFPFKKTVVNVDILDVIDEEFVDTHTTVELCAIAQKEILDDLNKDNYGIQSRKNSGNNTSL